MKKENIKIGAFTTIELGKFVAETGQIPIHVYREKNARPLIIQSRSIYDRKRVKKRTKKPIKL